MRSRKFFLTRCFNAIAAYKFFAPRKKSSRAPTRRVLQALDAHRQAARQAFRQTPESSSRTALRDALKVLTTRSRKLCGACERG
jgi:hypothetical protein